MMKTVLKFGLISGALCSLMMAATIPISDKIGFDRSEFVGYSIIVLSFLLVFFGVRSYRNTAGNGQISFGKAFAVGISITLVTCICYVVTWEILYYNFLPGFMEKYTAYALAKAKASGASPAAIQAQMQKLQRYKELYDNPLFNAAVTFLEPFPIGLAVSLISAIGLRNTSRSQPSCPPGAEPSGA